MFLFQANFIHNYLLPNKTWCTSTVLIEVGQTKDRLSVDIWLLLCELQQQKADLPTVHGTVGQLHPQTLVESAASWCEFVPIQLGE